MFNRKLNINRIQSIMEDMAFLTKMTRLRNRTAHGYNKPTEEELIAFFKENKEHFYNIYKTIHNVKLNNV